MIKNNKFISIVTTVFICFIALISLVIVRDYFSPEQKSVPTFMTGVISPVNSDPIMINPGVGVPIPSERVFAKGIKLTSPTVDLAEPTPKGYDVYFIDTPEELAEGSPATFTWAVNGPPLVIETTTVYFGLQSNPK